MITEDFFFFRTGDRPLFGALYTPADGRCKRALVISDSLFEEKLWSERVHANLGRYLAERGIAVLSFDYYGYGNSPGESSEVDLTTLEKDLDSACDVMSNMGAGSMAILGVRWGAAVACRVANKRGDIDRLFLVEPVENWKTTLLQALRANLAGQYAIFKKTVITRDEIIRELIENGKAIRSGYVMNNVDGYFISKSFFEQSSSAVLPVKLKDTVDSVHIFRLKDCEKVTEPATDGLAGAFSALGTDCTAVTIHSQQNYWEYTRIFTSTATDMYSEIASVLACAEDGIDEWFCRDIEKADISPTIQNGDISETSVAFRNEKGLTLDGVLYIPRPSIAKKTGLVFSHGGLIGINGAFRFNTRAARRFASIGYPCFSFDNHGLGRGQGLIDKIDRRALFRMIQDGLFAGDVLRAVDFFRENAGCLNVGLFGVCGGSITNIIAHSRSSKIDFSVLLSMPVMLTFLSDNKNQKMTAGYARFYLGLYLRRIFNFRSWLRFVTFKSDYTAIFNSLSVLAADRYSKMKKLFAAGGKKMSGRMPANSCNQPKKRIETISPVTMSSTYINPEFINSYLNIVKKEERMLFIFGENDNFKWEFNSSFVEKMPAEFEAGGNLVDIIEIEHANHMYTLPNWQDKIMGKTADWIDKIGYK